MNIIRGFKRWITAEDTEDEDIAPLHKLDRPTDFFGKLQHMFCDIKKDIFGGPKVRHKKYDLSLIRTVIVEDDPNVDPLDETKRKVIERRQQKRQGQELSEVHSNMSDISKTVNNAKIYMSNQRETWKMVEDKEEEAIANLDAIEAETSKLLDTTSKAVGIFGAIQVGYKKKRLRNKQMKAAKIFFKTRRNLRFAEQDFNYASQENFEEVNERLTQSQRAYNKAVTRYRRICSRNMDYISVDPAQKVLHERF